MNAVSRNQPCPCGSGKRFKQCCGHADDRRELALPIVVPAAVPTAALAPILPVGATGELPLSIVLPYFRKLADFRRVLPINLRYFARAGIEVVLVLDENSEEAGLLALLAGHREVRWKVIVNDVAHEWRPPCVAINVGLRHASGRHVLVASPESAFVGDVPAMALEVMREHPQGIAIGRVAFSRFDDLHDGQSIEQRFAAIIPAMPYLNTFYGSICGPRSAFESIGGYDESLVRSGGDDDNIRVRLEMAGHALLACPLLRLLHLSSVPRHGGEHFDTDNDFLTCTPSSPTANANRDWGCEFARMPVIERPAASAGGNTPTPPPPPPPPATNLVALPPGAVVPTGSRRRCEVCGRLLHYDAPVIACAGCGAAPAIARAAASEPSQPKIACLMQLRNEARFLPGCLDHVRDHVDGIIALDDGSTDTTRQTLLGEAKLLDCLANPAAADHVWDERRNRLRLLERARELGIGWVLCCDADERFEELFLRNLRSIANSFPRDELACIAVTFRELWDSPRQYRTDGPWGTKIRARFFRLPDEISLDLAQELHGQWYPDRLKTHGRVLRVHHIAYHLKSIRREDRLARRQLYNRLDPEKRFQPQGYDYLAEEGDGMRLEAIRAGREYRYDTLPADLRDN